MKFALMIFTIGQTSSAKTSWKKKLFESAVDIFGPNNSTAKQTTSEQKKVEKLQAKLRDRDEAISYLIRENISIKKSIAGEN